MTAISSNWARRAMPALAAIAMGALMGLAPAPAWAFRCNSFVIDAGLHKSEVLKKCGAPTTQDTRIERRIVRVRNGSPTQGGQVEVEREVQVTIEEWVYNFGPSQFMQMVIFENGRIVGVKDLGYGS